MSIVDLVDDPDDERELHAALLGLSRWIGRFQQSCVDPTAVEAEALAPPGQDFVYCLLGIAALAAQLEAALSSWTMTSADPVVTRVQRTRAWGLLR